MWDGQVPCHPIDGARIVYVEVPKAGCTSVKHMLAPLKGRWDRADEIHHWMGYTHAADRHMLQRWLRDRWRDYFRFTVVRHPIDRFESFFYGRLAGTDINEYVQHQLRAETDIHAARLVDLLGDLDGFDFVGTLADTEAISARCSMAARTTLRMPHANAALPVEREELTAHSRAILLDHYAPDFRLLEGVGVL